MWPLRLRTKLVLPILLASCGARTGLETGARPGAPDANALDAPSYDAAEDGPVPQRDRGPQIVVGNANACYRKDGELRCWGFNSQGQLGDGTETDRYVPTKIDIPWVNEVALDRGHGCARLDDGSVRCWGGNGAGQIGAGAEAGAFVTTPTPVIGVNGAAALSNRGEGKHSTCAILASGNVKCWGTTTYGSFCGLSPVVKTSTAIDVPGLTGASVVRNSDNVTCALFSDGTVRCCGRNEFGELGDGTTMSRAEVGLVSGISGAVEIAMGGDFAFARMNDGTVRGWGYNQYGYVGNGPGPDVLSPVPVSGLTGVTGIAAAPVHACALLSDRTLVCWGDNRYGQLGDGTTQTRTVPTPVQGLRDILTYALGIWNTCAIVADGSVYCWGDNRYGALGVGTAGSFSAVPVRVKGL